jgi:predicted nucleotide-binding protein
MANLTKNEAIAKLTRAIEETEALKLRGRSSPEFKKWQRKTEAALSRIFGEQSRHLKDFNGIGYSLDFWTDSTPVHSWHKAYTDGLNEAKAILQTMIEEIQEDWDGEDVQQKTTEGERGPGKSAGAKPCVFIGHGRSVLWARLQLYLQNDLGLTTVNYEAESRVGDSIIPILEKMLQEADFAVLILTAEDETTTGERRARQNVIHEAGLFQGRLGFKKAVLLVQEGLQEFTNVAGLQYIGFSGDRIEQTFYELQRVLKREEILT